jgi:hypothetical protein
VVGGDSERKHNQRRRRRARDRRAAALAMRAARPTPAASGCRSEFHHRSSSAPRIYILLRVGSVVCRLIDGGGKVFMFKIAVIMSKEPKPAEY